MKVIECKKEGSSVRVVVFDEKRETLEGKPPKELAQQHAIKQGFNATGLSNIPVIHPVDAKGETTEAVVTGREKVAGYAIAYMFGSPPR